MVLGLKVKLVRLPEVAQRLVVLLPAGLQVVVGEVGQGEHQGAVLRLHPPEGLLLGGDLAFQLAHFLENGGSVLPGLLQLGDGLGDLVLLRLFLFHVVDDVPAFLVQGQDPVHLLVTVDFLGSEAGFHLFRVFLDALDVQHGITS